MKSIHRLCALVLLAALLLPACAQNSPNVPDTTAALPAATEPVTEPVTEETTTSREQAKDNLPENLRFDGETIRITCRGNDSFQWELIAEDTGDVVESAIYDRNLAVEERLGITLNVIPGASKQATYMDNVRATILAGTDDFDIVAGAQYKAAQMVLDNCWRNLKNEKYLDFDQPWWDSVYMENLTVDPAQVYMLAGDLTLTKIDWTACIYFNKGIYRDAFGDPDELYRTVLDGGWTLDMLSSLCSDVYQDLNSDGKKDDGDVMGMWLNDRGHTDRITFAMGVRYSERDENGYPNLIFNNERTVRYVEEILKFFHENKGTSYAQGGPETFKNGGSLFTSSQLLGSKDFRDTDLEYGILPWPKLDADQKEYYSGVMDNIALYMLPATVNDGRAEMLGAVLEAMCAENYRHVIRSYYESALKFKYSDGQLYSNIVDLIHNSATTDIIYVYSYSLNEIGTWMRTLLSDNNPNFASVYKTSEEAVKASLDKLIAYFKENHPN